MRCCFGSAPHRTFYRSPSTTQQTQQKRTTHQSGRPINVLGKANRAVRDAKRAASLCTEDAMLYETSCAEYYEQRREAVFNAACLKHDEYVVEYHAQGTGT